MIFDLFTLLIFFLDRKNEETQDSTIRYYNYCQFGCRWCCRWNETDSIWLILEKQIARSCKRFCQSSLRMNDDVICRRLSKARRRGSLVCARFRRCHDTCDVARCRTIFTACRRGFVSVRRARWPTFAIRSRTSRSVASADGRRISPPITSVGSKRSAGSRRTSGTRNECECRSSGASCSRRCRIRNAFARCIAPRRRCVRCTTRRTANQSKFEDHKSCFFSFFVFLIYFRLSSCIFV